VEAADIQISRRGLCFKPFQTAIEEHSANAFEPALIAPGEILGQGVI
jgi:hypothetical protein